MILLGPDRILGHLAESSIQHRIRNMRSSSLWSVQCHFGKLIRQAASRDFVYVMVKVLILHEDTEPRAIDKPTPEHEGLFAEILRLGKKCTIVEGEIRVRNGQATLQLLCSYSAAIAMIGPWCERSGQRCGRSARIFKSGTRVIEQMARYAICVQPISPRESRP
jgi:hypothetical protein